MASARDISEGMARARRTAALARAVMSVAALLLTLLACPPGATTFLAAAGFVIAGLTAAVQVDRSRSDWLTLEESIAPVSALLIVGLGHERVGVDALIWLSIVACGVLARGGRQHWLGRAVLLSALALPIVLSGRVHPPYALFCLATVALLLTCGRTTRELRAMYARARWEADHDDLTGALTRHAFRAALEHAAQARDGDALVLLDVDNLGAVNRSAGHAAGDLRLTTLAGELTRLAGSEGAVGRLGGDEFAVVLPGEGAEARVRGHLGVLAAPRDGAPSLRASAGLVHVGRPGETADELLHAADVALRVAKRTGDHGLAVYEGASFSDGGALGSLERLTSGADISVAVQPIVSIADHTVHAFEALARFPGRGPLHWFALADELGVRDDLELACLRAALSTFAARPAGTRLSINLSGPLLLDPRVQALFADLDDLDGLILEMTENSLVDDSAPELGAEIERLLARGLRFAVDDMGAGYSGLRQITAIRPTYLKLDRSLVQGIDTDLERAALIAAMVLYAERTGGHLVAEGVESATELAVLRDLGVELVQGFLLARPGWPWPAVAPAPAAIPSAVTPAMAMPAA